MIFDKLNAEYNFSGVQVLIFFIILALLGKFWLDHQEDVKKIQQLESQLLDLQNKYGSLETEHKKLQQDYATLKNQYDAFRKDTSELLAEYITKEVAWDITGLSKYRTLLCGVQIYLRDKFPAVNSIPC